MFCNLIQALKSKSNLAPCDKKSHSEHQILLLTHVRGSGQETVTREEEREGTRKERRRKERKGRGEGGRWNEEA